MPKCYKQRCASKTAKQRHLCSVMLAVTRFITVCSTLDTVTDTVVQSLGDSNFRPPGAPKPLNRSN